TWNADKTFLACCIPGHRLLGDIHTAFDCCADGHSLTGNDRTGYRCCPVGQSYDGYQCGSVCKHGRIMVDGECVCPPGTSPAADGGCKGPVGCDSGLTTAGTCYAFKTENGHTFGYDSRQLYYSAADHSNQHRLGKFKFCKNERCTADNSVNPNDAVHIQDIQGIISHSSGPRWLSKVADGTHIGRTPRYEDSGLFSITKWSCGKYCFGGYEEGVSYHSDTYPLTFTADKQACIPVEIMEVPCDIHAIENNCMWEKAPGAC
ncbi:hypothetical protein M426DRAFT_34099, partial [Hypoxylon sp. CI-4A]